MSKMAEILPISITIPEYNRVYAIGDIQGQRDQLLGILAMVKKDLCDHPLRQGQKSNFVFLGDYVDRGDDAKGVIDILVDLKKSDPQNVFLEGNHDEDFYKIIRFAAGDEKVSKDFALSIARSGWDTLGSYGVKIVFRDTKWNLAQIKTLPEKVPLEHREFLNTLPFRAQFNNYIFVHNPHEVMGRKWIDMPQEEKDAVWDYLHNLQEQNVVPLAPDHPLRTKMTVHGHVQISEHTDSFEYTDRRIGLCDSYNFYYPPSEDLENIVNTISPDGEDIGIHCVVLERDRAPRFLSYYAYTYTGAEGPGS